MASPEKAIELLSELSNLVERGTRVDLLTRALRTANQLVDADAASLVFASSRRRGERVVLYPGSDTPAVLKLPLDKSDVLRVFTENRAPLGVPDLSDNPGLLAGDACPGVEAGPVLYTPVPQRDPLPAYLAVYRKRGRAKFSVFETQTMQLLAAWLSAALENLRLSAGTERLALTDDLTEIYNFRFVKSALRRETRRANRFRQELSILVIEVDGWGAYREARGHQAGHLLLKEMSTLLAQQVRSFDILGRYEDDSFVVVLPQTGADGAAEAAERMRAAIEERAFANNEAGAITATFGIASFPQDGNDADALLPVADRAVEQGRLQGGNRVASSMRKAA